MSQNAMAKLFGTLSVEDTEKLLATLKSADMAAVADKLTVALRESAKDIESARKITKAEAAKSAKEAQDKLDAAALENLRDVIGKVGREYKSTFDLQLTFGSDGAVTVKAQLTGDSLVAIADAVAAKVKLALGQTVVKEGLTVVITEDGAAVKGKHNNPTGKRKPAGDSGNPGTPYVGSGDRRVEVDGRVYAQASDACKAAGIDWGKQSPWVALLDDGDSLKSHGVKIAGTYTEKLAGKIQKQVAAGNLTVAETLEM
jgi:hypothetical protein